MCWQQFRRHDNATGEDGAKKHPEKCNCDCAGKDARNEPEEELQCDRAADVHRDYAPLRKPESADEAASLWTIRDFDK